MDNHKNLIKNILKNNRQESLNLQIKEVLENLIALRDGRIKTRIGYKLLFLLKENHTYKTIEDSVEDLSNELKYIFIEEEDLIQTFWTILVDFTKDPTRYTTDYPQSNNESWYISSKQAKEEAKALSKFESTLSGNRLRFILFLSREINVLRDRVKERWTSSFPQTNNQDVSLLYPLPFISKDLIFCRYLTNWEQYILYLTEIEEYSVRDIEALTGYAKSSIHDSIVKINELYRSKNES
jgi:hypothetical protein